MNLSRTRSSRPSALHLSCPTSAFGTKVCLPFIRWCQSVYSGNKVYCPLAIDSSGSIKSKNLSCILASLPGNLLQWLACKPLDLSLPLVMLSIQAWVLFNTDSFTACCTRPSTHNNTILIRLRNRKWVLDLLIVLSECACVSERDRECARGYEREWCFLVK